jgi:hypothetical protein
MGLEGNVTKHDHFVVSLHLFEGTLEKGDGIESVTAEPVFVRLRDSPRRVYEAFARRVFTCPQEQRLYCILGFLAAGPCRVACLLFPAGHRSFLS